MNCEVFQILQHFMRIDRSREHIPVITAHVNIADGTECSICLGLSYFSYTRVITAKSVIEQVLIFLLTYSLLLNR